jgi:formylglycine-generating enzyme required for sulfatase activity
LKAAEPLVCLEASKAESSTFTGMVWIPPGTFAFGDSVYPEEQPIRKISVAGFWMDRTEVTNAQFEEFVKATGYVTSAERAVDPIAHPDLPPELIKPGAVVFISPVNLTRGGDVSQWWQYVPDANWRRPLGPKSSIIGRESHPVVSVTIEDAQAYARWKGRELPSEREWEWAASGGQATRPGDRNQPEEANTWQGLFPVTNQARDGFVGASPVACFKANTFGLFDMIGNVWELTSDPYTESHNPQDNVPPDQVPVAQRPGQPGGRHVIKGGSFLCAPNYCMRYRAGARQGQEDDLATSHVGFRTILRAAGP